MILAGNGKKAVVGYFRKGRLSRHHCVTVQQKTNWKGSTVWLITIL